MPKPLEGIKVSVGSAGLTALSKEFNRKLGELVKKRIKEHEMANLGLTDKPIESLCQNSTAVPLP